jgi:uncharacterized membrane protein
MRKKRVSAYLINTLVILLMLTSHQSFSEEMTSEILFLTVYTDGFVFVDFSLLIDETFPTQNITVFGQVLEDLLVVDKDGLPLDYLQNKSMLTVFSLGTDEIGITYQTQDLTSKEGRYWTLTLLAPINTRIILPEETTIISLNKVPEMIETNNDKVNLLMTSGVIEITYVVGIVGTQVHAQIVLDDAEAVIMEIKNLGVIVTDAEIKLQEAYDAFTLGNYAEAETLGNNAKNLVLQINQTASQSQSLIIEAEISIASAENEGRTIGLNDAKDLLNQAKSTHELGTYSEALSLASQAISKAKESTIFNSNETENFPIIEVFGVIMISTAVLLGFFFSRSNKKPEAEEKKKKRRIDSDRIFREHKNLMPEEKQAIQYLVDNNGEALEAELYDYVKLPRTTTWRMVKRLKGMNILSVTKFRRQNLVRLKNKYDIKE